MKEDNGIRLMEHELEYMSRIPIPSSPSSCYLAPYFFLEKVSPYFFSLHLISLFIYFSLLIIFLFSYSSLFSFSHPGMMIFFP